MSGFGMVLAMRLSDKCDSNNELLTLLAIGNYVDENGRGCYAAQQTLADKVLISLDTVKRCIPRLAAKGLIAPGDQNLVADFRADRRPRVWDILGAREPADETGVHAAPPLNRRNATKASTGVRGAPPSDNPSSATGHVDPPFAENGPTGVQTISPRGCTVHPNPPKEEPAKTPPPVPADASGRETAEPQEEVDAGAFEPHPDALAVIAAVDLGGMSLVGKLHDEVLRILTQKLAEGWTPATLKPKFEGCTINASNPPGVFATRVRALGPPLGPTARDSPALEPWCGKCGDKNPICETNARWRTLDGTLKGEICPDCHPDRKAHP